MVKDEKKLREKEKKRPVALVVEELAKPLVENLGLKLWDVRFEKEGSLWYLRIMIDKEEGVSISDCEIVNRSLGELLDKLDPIDKSYVLQVSSPGVERELVKKEHFDAFLGSEIHVRLIRPIEGLRDFTGTLEAVDEDGNVHLLIGDDLEMVFRLKETAFVRLMDSQDGLDDFSMEEEDE